MNREEFYKQVELIDNKIKGLQDDLRRLSVVYQGTNEYKDLEGKVVIIKTERGNMPYKPFFFDGVIYKGHYLVAKGVLRKKDGSMGERRVEIYLGKKDEIVEVK